MLVGSSREFLGALLVCKTIMFKKLVDNRILLRTPGFEVTSTMWFHEYNPLKYGGQHQSLRRRSHVFEFESWIDEHGSVAGCSMCE